MHIYTMIQELNRLFPTGTRISNKELYTKLENLEAMIYEIKKNQLQLLQLMIQMNRHK